MRFHPDCLLDLNAFNDAWCGIMEVTAPGSASSPQQNTFPTMKPSTMATTPALSDGTPATTGALRGYPMP